MILVTGATGKVGSALVQQLQAAGLPFRALAHSAASLERLRARRIDAAPVDATRPEELVDALRGARRLFLLTPSGPEQAASEARYVDAARRADVGHIVKLSTYRAEDPSIAFFQHHRASEQYIRASGVPYTFLRPNMFMQHLGAADAPMIRGQSAIINSAGEGQVSFVDVADIAAVAVAALRDDSHQGQVHVLTGRERLTYGEVAARLGALLGREVRYVALADDAYAAALRAAGLSDWYAEGLPELNRYFRDGKGGEITNTVERITGRPARTIDDYLAESRETFA